MSVPIDRRGRALRDLRISVTDRCNFRCRYCMPRDRFGGDHRFLERRELLDFEEIERVARILSRLGVRKIRITGGEPLLRRDLPDLVRMLAPLGVELAMTTNGSRLRPMAAALREAGLGRLTVSLDSLDPDGYRRITDSDSDVDQVLAGLEKALAAGFPPPKLNTVLRRGWNEDQIFPLVERFVPEGHEIRFIEYMDVGGAPGWRLEEVVPAAEVRSRLRARYPLEPLAPSEPGAPAVTRYRIPGWRGAIGLIASVTEPFCGGCTRLRLAADGRLYTCLFSPAGHDLKTLLRGGASDSELEALLSGLWRGRNDRYSELRTAETALRPRPAMSYLGG